MGSRKAGAGRGDESSTSSVGPFKGERGDLPGHLLSQDDLSPAGAYTVAEDETEAEELTGVGESGARDAGSLEVLDADQLEDAETVASQARSARPQRRQAAPPPVKKDSSTPRRERRRSVEVRHRTSPAQFTRESVEELKKVVWPTPIQVRQYFTVVLIFVLFIILYVGLLDLGFGALLLRLLG